MPLVCCFDEVLLRLESPPNERLLRSSGLQASFAGAEANVAVTLSSLGRNCRLVSRLPPGRPGDACIEEPRWYRLDAETVVRSPGRIPLFFAEPGAMRRPQTTTYDREGSAFSLAERSSFDWQSILGCCDWFPVSGITPALSEAAAQATMDAIRCTVGTNTLFEYPP